MKILSAAQTRAADAYTIAQEPISSIDLMERASGAVADWLKQKYSPEVPFYFFCGPGNNGGDGMAVARLLHHDGYDVQVFLVETGQNQSADFSQNLERLPQAIPVTNVQTTSDLPAVPLKAVIVDGLFGTGLSRPLEGIYAEVVEYLNQHQGTVVSIDIPSGLFTDAPTPAQTAVIKADYTLTFEQPKLAFLLPASGSYAGEWHVLPIGLHPEFLAQVETPHQLLTHGLIENVLRPRSRFSHKGTFGHALLVGGSYGKMGAITMSAHAALRAGLGLLTVQVPTTGYTILQTAVPEAMVLTDAHEQHLSQFPEDLSKYQCLGIGPGLGQAEDSRLAMESLFRQKLPPLILDADALNLLASDRLLRQNLPANSILTPHPKEFERLTGPATDDFHRLQLLQSFCAEHDCYVILKGAHTCIGTPTEEFFFNTTGNPGMATGGTGDVLTGILTALRAQGYSPLETCQLGVYLHGLAGDIAAEVEGEASLIASDLYKYLGAAFRKIHLNQK
ncbi:bifunctional ADP-dependent NAD(P)H-hydrate dehydratase/NAD(P)H-hydrate epimerase [Rufibacter tibetensis]|uniref:Bifunctional NAD(P)H-hydrate repair enzyme n=1 Tax=Rufibacter tibetensis TaxID=512763 RepID=A0A0P0CV64_9BACT|nr:bifunctional ADP-dependent NAD(P)H-hydrate dehydratase/NAD(P)H-hydrate epimerase [Rufibacter tibetensis]ALI99206.1 carbohydrate kinase [Rufibacter tibetensis]